MQRKTILYFLALSLASCATQNSWQVDHISSENAGFDSSRLCYASSKSHLKLEFIKTENQLQAYLLLDQHKFSPSPLDRKCTEVSVKIDEQETKELISLRSGRMKVRLPQEMRQKITLALQEGKPVVILLDGFQETFLPNDFSKLYAKLTEDRFEIFNFLKGPLE